MTIDLTSIAADRASPFSLPPHKEQSPVRAFEPCTGDFLFGSFLRRFDRRFRRRGGFSFNELIQLLTADRNSLE